MGDPVFFHGANTRLGPPPGAENVGDLYTFTNGYCSVSCWQLSPAEIDEVNRSGRIFVSILSGRSQPPVFVGDEDSVRGVVVDYGGVWTKAGSA